MPPIDRLLSQYSNPVRSWPGEEDLDAEARANYAAANPPKLQTEGGSIDKGDLLPIVRYPEAKKSPSEWQSSSDVMRQLDDGWRIEPFSRLMAPFKSMAEAWRNQPVLGPMVRPSQMNPEAFNQMSSDAMTVAGTGMTGGIGRAAVGSPVPHGVTELGIFGGRKAKTADLDALARAEEMVRIGRPREEVWSETGWFQGPDKQWRFEIDDSGNVMTGEGANYHPGRLRSEILDQGASREGIAASGYQGRLDRVLDHKDAFAAYPDLAGTTWASVPGEKMAVPNVGGVWKGDRFGMEINADYSPRLQTGKSITLHELQHGIQDAENFARGSNVGMFELSPEQIAGGHRQLAEMGDAEIIRETAERYHLTPREAAAKVEQDFGRPLDPDSRAISIAEMHPVGRIQEMAGRLRQRLSDATDPKSAYNRTAGEAEARLVQKRIDMTDAERRARPPWLDYDVPEKDQIVRFGNESGAMSNKPLDMSPEARLARAREMGFDTDRVLYHGSPDFRDVRASQAFEARTRNEYNIRTGEWEKIKQPVYLSPDRHIARSYADDTRAFDYQNAEPEVFSGYGRLSDPLRINALGNKFSEMPISTVRQQIPPETVALFDDLIATYVGDRPKGNIKTGDLEVIAQKMGHDGFVISNVKDTYNATGKPGQVVAIFDPSNIRSVDADFDPSLSSSPTLMASIDPLTAAVSPPRQVDPLGYYSPTLDAALRLSQKKGTPEQMLAQLKKAGAKDSEIEVSGLKKMFEGKKSVSQEEIVKALEEGRVGLNEVVYRADSEDVELRAERNQLSQAYREAERRGDEDAMDAAEARMSEIDETLSESEGLGSTRYASYSLDPENPTYREVVLHLPERNFAETSAMKAAVARRMELDQIAQTRLLTPEEKAELRQLPSIIRDIENGQHRDNVNFRSGHFDEPNIVGHMMVSETRLPGNPNARVLTLDQVQSDWGQKLRDGGVRDEAKVAALDAKWKDGFAALEAHRAQGMPLRDAIASRHGLDPGNANADGWLAARGREMELPAETLQEINAYFAQRNRLMNDHRLAEAELSTAKAASPGHPLVNTTDQWLNTTLRRAIRMASEEGQDYIAIPSGHTVLSYNPGQEGGMLGFYGGTPQEMSYLVGTLRDVAKTTPDAKVIDALDPKSIDALAKAGILDKKKIEGISVSRVLKNAESRFQGIVPKNLYALLQKLDKATPPPQVIDTLDSPSGKTGLGEGFTLFKITPEAKKAAKESGQPLFRFGGRVN